MDSKKGIASTYNKIIVETNGAMKSIVPDNIGAGIFSGVFNCSGPGIIIPTNVHGSKIP